MDALFQTLASFGNWAFWLVAMSITTMVILTMFFGDLNRSFVSLFTIKGHASLQKIARLSAVLVLVFCPFVECDYLLHDLTHPLLRVGCVYLSAIFGFGLVFIACYATAVIILCLSRIYYWVMDKEWKPK